MKQVAKEAHALRKTSLEKMKTVARAYFTKQGKLASKGSISSNATVVAS